MRPAPVELDAGYLIGGQPIGDNRRIETSEIIIHQLRRLGWHVTRHYVDDTVELHAIKLDGSAEPQIARCNDGDDADEEYRVACLLAEACGVDLEDG
jgi:hypothetical protein